MVYMDTATTKPNRKESFIAFFEKSGRKVWRQLDFSIHLQHQTETNTA